MVYNVVVNNTCNSLENIVNNNKKIVNKIKNALDHRIL